MNLANKITIFRILLIPFFIACLLYYGETRPYLRIFAFIIFGIATFTDAIDGGIARSRGQMTELGRVLDPIADKLLIMSGVISLSLIKTIPQELRIPAWIVITVISRDVIIILGAVVIYLIKNKITVKPSWLGKITTFLQMTGLLLVLGFFRYNKYFLYPAVVFTLLSGFDYIWRGSRQLNEINS